MEYLRKLIKQFYIYLIWIALVILIWPTAWKFFYNTTPAKKIVMYVHVYDYADPELAAAMEGGMLEKEKMVKILTFDQGSNHEDKFSTADLYLGDSGDTYTLSGDILPLTEFAAAHPEYTYYCINDVPYGVRIYDYSSQEAVMTEYISYRVTEDNLKLGNNLSTSSQYYVYVGANSLHNGQPGSIDDSAFKVLEHMMTLP